MVRWKDGKERIGWVLPPDCGEHSGQLTDPILSDRGVEADHKVVLVQHVQHNLVNFNYIQQNMLDFLFLASGKRVTLSKLHWPFGYPLCR